MPATSLVQAASASSSTRAPSLQLPAKPKPIKIVPGENRPPPAAATAATATTQRRGKGRSNKSWTDQVAAKLGQAGALAIPAPSIDRATELIQHRSTQWQAVPDDQAEVVSLPIKPTPTARRSASLGRKRKSSELARPPSPTWANRSTREAKVIKLSELVRQLEEEKRELEGWEQRGPDIEAGRVPGMAAASWPTAPGKSIKEAKVMKLSELVTQLEQEGRELDETRQRAAELEAGRVPGIASITWPSPWTQQHHGAGSPSSTSSDRLGSPHAKKARTDAQGDPHGAADSSVATSARLHARRMNLVAKLLKDVPLFTDRCLECDKPSPRSWSSFSCPHCPSVRRRDETLDLDAALPPPRMEIAYTGFRADLGGACIALGDVTGSKVGGVVRDGRDDEEGEGEGDEVEGSCTRRTWKTWDDGVTTCEYEIAVRAGGMPFEGDGERRRESQSGRRMSSVGVRHALPPHRQPIDADDGRLSWEERKRKLLHDLVAPQMGYVLQTAPRCFSLRFAPGGGEVDRDAFASLLPHPPSSAGTGSTRGTYTDDDGEDEGMPECLYDACEYINDLVSRSPFVSRRDTSDRGTTQPYFCAGTVVVGYDLKMVFNTKILPSLSLSPSSSIYRRMTKVPTSSFGPPSLSPTTTTTTTTTTTAKTNPKPVLSLCMSSGDCINLEDSLWSRCQVSLSARGLAVWILFHSPADADADADAPP
ncbi:uncharacterized protein PSFLO_05842 [Pseudozyma flocculosa]|uniref:Uncharacterized protein n=1 Tax=Pseudozyma flocculosa TaxID=84751 RepID=A0A5C3F814_9BASI|nr:uncharacterized protein PSFLO_05842 [Pseudozyma flocculosa]